jgi:hypothetical protein
MLLFVCLQVAPEIALYNIFERIEVSISTSIHVAKSCALCLRRAQASELSIGAELGRGAFGVVYRGDNTRSLDRVTLIVFAESLIVVLCLWFISNLCDGWAGLRLLAAWRGINVALKSVSLGDALDDANNAEALIEGSGFTV